MLTEKVTIPRIKGTLEGALTEAKWDEYNIYPVDWAVNLLSENSDA